MIWIRKELILRGCVDPRAYNASLTMRCSGPFDTNLVPKHLERGHQVCRLDGGDQIHVLSPGAHAS